MKLTLRAEPDAGETAPTVETIGAMAEADWQFIVDMMGSLYDEAEPKQDADGAGNLLFTGSDGLTYTGPQVDAALADPQNALSFAPKSRPRTTQEIHSKIAAGLTKGIWASALKRKEELDLRALSASAKPATVPATPVTPIS